jgi:hypothetical protein
VRKDKQDSNCRLAVFKKHKALFLLSARLQGSHLRAWAAAVMHACAITAGEIRGLNLHGDQHMQVVGHSQQHLPGTASKQQ